MARTRPITIFGASGTNGSTRFRSCRFVISARQYVYCRNRCMSFHSVSKSQTGASFEYTAQQEVRDNLIFWGGGSARFQQVDGCSWTRGEYLQRVGQLVGGDILCGDASFKYARMIRLGLGGRIRLGLGGRRNRASQPVHGIFTIMNEYEQARAREVDTMIVLVCK